MLEIFLKLVDRIIQFEKHRLDRRQSLFRDLIEPTFVESSTVYSDYRQMLVAAKTSIKNGGLTEAIGKLRSDRELYLTTRTKLGAMADALDGQKRFHDLPESLSFSELVAVYLFSIQAMIGTRAHQTAPMFVSVGYALIDSISGATQEEAIQHIDQALQKLEHDFQSVATRYGQLRAAAYLSDELAPNVLTK